MRVGFIGLGNIGGRCVRHVLLAGHELTVTDLVEAGANSAVDPVGGLARLEIDAMLNAIPDRWTDIEVVGPPTWTRTNRLSGLKTLPIQFTDAA